MTTTCPHCGRLVEASYTDRYGLGYRAMTNAESPVSMAMTWRGTSMEGEMSKGESKKHERGEYGGKGKGGKRGC